MPRRSMHDSLPVHLTSQEFLPAKHNHHSATWEPPPQFTIDHHQHLTHGTAGKHNCPATLHMSPLWYNTSARLELATIRQVFISGLQFIGCTGNTFSSVEELVLENSIFQQGEYTHGTLLFLHDIGRASIVASNSLECTGDKDLKLLQLTTLTSESSTISSNGIPHGTITLCIRLMLPSRSRPYLAIGQGGQLLPQRNWLQSIIKYYLFIAASYWAIMDIPAPLSCFSRGFARPTSRYAQAWYRRSLF